MANQTFHVLNAQLAPCPVWVPGQLHIGGVGLAKGYWRDDEKTNASFIVHPTTGERLYRTGDLGRYLPDGNIEFLGREDFQVKVHGHRIELGEIEVHLLECEGVDTCAVTVREDRPGEKRLVAYVVPTQDLVETGLDGKNNIAPDQASGTSRASETVNPIPDDVFVEELRNFLCGKLPAYMVPATFMLLDALPLSANGKVDRKTLPAPERIDLYISADQVEPTTETERVLAAIWQDILGIGSIGINDNLFELGGDSYMIIQIVVRANQAGIQISPEDIFEHQTVAELAKVNGTVHNTAASMIKPIGRHVRRIEHRPTD